MTLNDVLTKQNLITKVLLANDGKELSKELKVKIMKIRVAMGKIRKNFEDDLKEVAEGLIPEGYKELAQIKDKTPEQESIYKEQTDALNAAYQKYVVDEGTNEVTGNHIDDKFTEDEYFEIVGVNGSISVDINGTSISGPDFLDVIYSIFVEA